jgi:hypothetical protein
VFIDIFISGRGFPSIILSFLFLFWGDPFFGSMGTILGPLWVPLGSPCEPLGLRWGSLFILGSYFGLTLVHLGCPWPPLGCTLVAFLLNCSTLWDPDGQTSRKMNQQKSQRAQPNKNAVVSPKEMRSLGALPAGRVPRLPKMHREPTQTNCVSFAQGDDVLGWPTGRQSARIDRNVKVIFLIFDVMLCDRKSQTCRNIPQYAAIYHNIPQYTAIHRSIPQYTTINRNISR